MSQLSDKQRQFTYMVSNLVQFAYSNGYALSFGCARCAKAGHHMKGSLHYYGLAIDLNLFIKQPDGSWKVATDSEDHLPLGQFWESIGGSWGGRFIPADGNHYSLAFGGKR